MTPFNAMRFAQAVAGAPDPDFASVALLCHCNGANNGTVFPDSSSYARTVTAVGSAITSTSNPKFGSASFNSNGAGTALTVPDSASLEMGSGDFTIEMWYRTNSGLTATGYVISKHAVGAGDINPLGWYVLSNGTIGIVVSVNGTTYGINATSSAGAMPNDNTDRHIACVRYGDEFDVYVSGTSVVGGTLSGTIHDNANVWTIGAGDPNGLASLIGFMDEIRITVGLARYTGNFSPPTAVFPDS